MTYTKNISRKKDFKAIEAIIDYNEYHPRNVNVTFDKNFFFYQVMITPGKGIAYEEIVSVHPSVLKKLYSYGFIVQDVHLRITTGGFDTWFIQDDIQFKSLKFKMELKLVRISELDKYFLKGSFY